jgi:hypothetical protein
MLWWAATVEEFAVLAAPSKRGSSFVGLGMLPSDLPKHNLG